MEQKVMENVNVIMVSILMLIVPLVFMEYMVKDVKMNVQVVNQPLVTIMVDVMMVLMEMEGVYV